MVSSSNVSVGIFVLALSLVFFFAVAESLTSPTQLYASKACSLGGSFSDRDAQLQCQLNSTQGVQDGVISLMFGEKNCRITLRDCFPNLCYGILDLTTALPVNEAAGAMAGRFLTSMRVLSGGVAEITRLGTLGFFYLH
uniref:Uncharacterized protein n=1 Tax=Palpitomonas bilix TaxID=652834 RepID=A0A7S3D688_9EUKA|mmetsp:Transcript_23076/g.58505  ORF Transcript_23076/g.58505 Transcript_23076/m.58505 type:complete len:139 (+) Transcript_23076:268-684(+)